MDTDKIGMWVRIILAIVSVLLGAKGQVQLASSLASKHELW